MEELIGYLASNNKLSKILAVLDSKGAMNSQSIAKTTRIVGVDKNIEELVEKNLLVLKSGKYHLTNKGEKVIHMLRNMR